MVIHIRTHQQNGHQQQATTNFFELSNLWKSFMAAVAGFTMTRLIKYFRGTC